MRTLTKTNKIEPPEPHTPEEEVVAEILTAPIETDEDYKKLAELADDDE